MPPAARPFGQIIFLHGPSSSGKSTLARAIQARIDLPFWHFSVDHLRDSGALPHERIARGDFPWSEQRARVFDGLHGMMTAAVNAGNNLILEHILDTEGWAAELRHLFAPFDVVFVGLHCDLAELTRRETARGDRPVGSAAADFHQVHRGRLYDLELNGRDDPDRNADKVIAVWKSGERRSEFRGIP